MIREAQARDLELLLDWRMEVLAHVFEGRRLDSLRQANRRYYQAQLGNGHVACFALDPEATERICSRNQTQRENGEPNPTAADTWQAAVIGCGGVCLQQEMPSPDNPSGRCGYLMNIYVRPEYRHQGHAREIVEWLMKQASDWGADKIWLEASEDGRPLYETLGFADLPGMMAIEPHRREEKPEAEHPVQGGNRK